MLEYFDHLLFNAMVEYNTLINRCMDDPAFAAMVDDSRIGYAQEVYIIRIVGAAEEAGAISLDDWRIIRHIVGMIGVDPDEFTSNDQRYEVAA